jgi:hypothetical protein
MGSLDLTTLVSALIGAAPAVAACVYANKGLKQGKQINETANNNSDKLHELGNGLMDQKIERAINKTLDDLVKSNPQLVSETTVASVIDRLLTQQLKDD